MSIFLYILTVLVLVLFAAVCSGLNVAIMSLDVADLRRKSKLGDKRAKAVLPLRRHIHLTLASILLVNVAAVSTTSLVMESRLAGVLAGIISTLLLVIFGEIIPQSIFGKNPLLWTSRLAPVMRIMIAVSYIISKPLQLLLDRLIGKQESKLQSRHELGLMITEHLGSNASELDEDEVEIIRGALQLSEKHVRDIMTPIKHVFWLTPSTVIDAQKIDEIKENGYSRIPIFNTELTICYGVLLIKQLLDIDFEDYQPRVDELLLHPAQIVGGMTALDTMFRKFIGAHGHLMPIEHKDKIIGIVTIEDLIEEIVGHEIEDETD